MCQNHTRILNTSIITQEYVMSPESHNEYVMSPESHNKYVMSPESHNGSQ